MKEGDTEKAAETAEEAIDIDLNDPQTEEAAIKIQVNTHLFYKNTFFLC